MRLSREDARANAPTPNSREAPRHHSDSAFFALGKAQLKPDRHELPTFYAKRYAQANPLPC